MHSGNRVGRSIRAFLILFVAIVASPVAGAEGPPPGVEEAVSFDQQIRPILQANCQGCHQPAKPGGEYVMTTFAGLLLGGESEIPAIVPGKVDESYLLDLITPEDGEASMPQGKPPLADDEIALIRQWIEQGAVDDSPTAPAAYDASNPPVYTRPPVITSLDYSPDGKQLAVAGFHEVLLIDTTDSQLVARLIGLAERIESVRFSPDGKRLAVSGGLPTRMGEIQIWNVADRQLELSVPVTHDTLHGVSWSPDGSRLAFGCADNTLRAIDTATGAEVLFQGAHNDWVLDTVFSSDGSHVVSVGRDMSVKLTEVETQRFIDNVTSITPGVLKGGIQAVCRHPSLDAVVIGGADGVPRVYRTFRKTKRVIGDDANLIRKLPPVEGRIFSVAISPDGNTIAAGASLDGVGEVRIYHCPIDLAMPDKIKAINEKVVTQRTAAEHAELEKFHTEGVKLLHTIAVPESAVFALGFHPDGSQLAATGADGAVRLFDLKSGKKVGQFSPAPLDRADAAQLALGTEGSSRGETSVDFLRDVSPVLSRLGCNTGTCHGSAKGKNGFKLSLRGYDPVFDVRALTDDHASRRVNLASPDDSLMLLKPTGAVAHVGGKLTGREDPYYKILRDWIASGAKLDMSTARVASLEVSPKAPVVQRPGERQAFRVTATYGDGSTRDVTGEAFLTSGNTEVATADPEATMTAVRRGEAPLLVRYEGAYTATTLTVMGDREGFEWQDPSTFGRIDELTAAKWKRMQIRPSELCGDAEFIRRVSLDLIGLPPTAAEVRDFVADGGESRSKRDALVDRLVGSDDFVEYWTNKWADLLQVNRKFLGAEGAAAFRGWIREQVAGNKPYDQFAREILTATGSNRENPAASYYKILRDPRDTMENTTQLFLGVRFNCNKCHDHPFERWTQDQYYQTAAFFGRTSLKPDPESKDRKIGGTAVEGAKPLYEIVYDADEGEVIHDRTQKASAPKFPFETKYAADENATRRQQMAAWMTSPDNRYFARSYVNRIWGYMLGTGIIEPIDDIRAGNPPSNPELLDYLTSEFVYKGFDTRHVIRLVCKSRTYQLSIKTNRWNEDDRTNYSHAMARRLPAEVLFDAVHRVTGSQSKIPGLPPGTRAAAIPDSGIKLADGFLASLGRPDRESSCECERSAGLELGPVMAMISGPTVGNAIADPKNELAGLVVQEPDNGKLINELFLRILNRPATEKEVQAALESLSQLPGEHDKLAATLATHEEELAPAIAALEGKRLEAIATAQSDLTAYEKQIAAREAELDKQYQDKIAQGEVALKAYEADLPAKLTEWEKRAKDLPVWTALEALELSATSGAKFDKQDDGSVFVKGANKKGSYKFVAQSHLPGITAVRLEVLADDRLPQRGPGRSPNGNFVLSEFRVEKAPEAEPEKVTAVKLQNAQANFSQQGYDVATAIDGIKQATDNGWATSPKVGVDRVAVFEAHEPIEEGSKLIFWLDQEFSDGKHTIGKFRISVTTSPVPVLLEGLPDNLATILDVAADKRTDEQKKTVLDYFRSHDGPLKKLEQDLAESRKPRAVDAGLKERREKLQQAEQPVPLDPGLVRLRKNVELSAKQLEQNRLTMVQDLAWALINSPAFLFNH